MYLVEWYEIVFLGSKIAKCWSCIWFNLITENSTKILASGVVGSRYSDNVSNLSLHMSQLSFLLWSWLYSLANSPQTEARVATLRSQPLCNLGQLKKKKKKKAPLSHWFQGIWNPGKSLGRTLIGLCLGLIILPFMNQSLWTELGCSDWWFPGHMLLPIRPPTSMEMASAGN